MGTMSQERPSDAEFTRDVYVIRVVMVGEADVGKTSLVKKFVNPSFDASSVKSTYGSDLNETKLTMDGKNIHLLAFDTSGAERYRALPRSYFRSAHAVMLVYDVTKRSSFEKLDGWMDDIETNAREHIVKLVVGNKADGANPRKVRHSEGREYADSQNAAFIETSATMGTAIEAAFEEVVSGALKIKEFWDSPKAVVKLSGPEEMPARKKRGCCST